MQDFTMSMFAKKEDLYKAKAEHFEEENEKLLAKIADSRAYALRLKGLLKEISSKTAANSIMVDDGIGDQKMAVLIEDINDLLNEADQI